MNLNCLSLKTKCFCCDQYYSYRRDVHRIEKNKRFQKILEEVKTEIPYIEKHIERIENANAIKKLFIKKSVKKKFQEIASRIANITRTITVFELSEKVDLTSVEREIEDVQLQIERLNQQQKEKANKWVLHFTC